MSAMRIRRTPERGCKLGWRRERDGIGLDPPRQPRSDFLEQPAIAIGIAEGGEGPVAAPLRIWTREAVVVTGAVENPGRIVKHLADVDAARDQRGACRLDIGDDEMESLRRSRRGRRHLGAEDD